MIEAKRSPFRQGDEFVKCPDCDHDGGWHIVLHRHPKTKSHNDVKLLLRCPNCKTTFDLDLHCCVEHTGLAAL